MRATTSGRWRTAARRLRPNRGPSAAHAGTAQAYTELGRFEEPEQALREAIRYDPENGGIYASLAALLRQRWR